jgi:hypothetical protein
MIGAPDMAFVRCFVLLYFALMIRRLFYWYEQNSLDLGSTEKVVLNLACLEKAGDLAVYADEALLELILKVKVILLEFQFLGTSHVGLYLGDIRIYCSDVCDGNAYRHTSRPNCLSLRLVKGMSEKPKSIVEYNLRSTGLPSTCKCNGNGADVVAHARCNNRVLVKVGSQFYRI